MERDIKFEKAVGDRIRKLREGLNWTQEYLANLADTEKKQIQRVEQAEYSVVMKTLTNIARALGRQPWELLKVGYRIKANNDLTPHPEKQPGATAFVMKLLGTNFFNTPKSVKQVVHECMSRYNVVLKSSAVSGVLRNLVKQKYLEDINAKIKGRYLYQKPQKKK